MKASNYWEIMKNRESFYTFLSRLYEKELSPGLLQQLKSLEYQTSDQDDMQSGFSHIRSYFDTSTGDMETELCVDFAKVFLAAGESKGKGAFPYESVYTSKEQIVMQEAWEQVRSIYAAKGLRLKTDALDIKEDHLAIELKFMAVLCHEFQAEKADFCLKEQREFMEKHLLDWVPAFCQDVKEYSRTEFYKGAAEITETFLNRDIELIDKLIEENLNLTDSFEVDAASMNHILKNMKKDYRIFAPMYTKKQNAKGQDVVRYGEIDCIEDIVYDRKSDFSSKEVYYPIMQTMLKFTDESCEESHLEDERVILLFVHPCDINAMSRLDTIFNLNGGHSDMYYKRMRDRVKLILLECTKSYENCFCVSMGANKADDYSMAIRMGDECRIQIKDKTLKPYFVNEKPCDFKPRFITSNDAAARLPVIEDKETWKTACKLEFWNKFDDKCIACGGCNTVCPTCSCFDTVDIIYDETSRAGERRRVWSSCMLSSFTRTAGGSRARKTNGAGMRFKTLHKVYDFKKRFNTEGNMCIGCGRCIAQCPEEISFLETINEFHDELEKAKHTGGQ